LFFSADIRERGVAVGSSTALQSLEVEVSIPFGVTGIFNPFGRTMALWSTQPLTEMSNRNISWAMNATIA
jgi:hypothetical protein